MEARRFFRVLWVLSLVVMVSVGCKLTDQIGELVGLVTEVVDLATDVDLEGLATEIDLEGLATEIDVEGLATEVAPFITDAGEFITGIPFLDEGTPRPVVTPAGFPADIPVMSGSILEMKGSPTELKYTIDVEFQTAVDFYRREMAARGWVESSSKSEEGEIRIVFTKGGRTAEVKIQEEFFFGVEITILVQG